MENNDSGTNRPDGKLKISGLGKAGMRKNGGSLVDNLVNDTAIIIEWPVSYK
ncbi:MAG TPA: hypothetical protein PK509_01000 [Catalimonadaceae bacterium]|nr:hypothetical protein [Catalimonadaceae bacterium]HPI12056.1 hypothetical protein [Catalimonadaceae bacterium]